MGAVIAELAHFIAGTPWDAIPTAVREHAKLVLLDTLGVILAGSVQPEVAGVRARLTATGGQGATIYASGAPRSDPRTAAFLNGPAGRSIELCEGHRYVSCQGAMQALPAALACAEWLQRPSRQALAALIFGYEVAARLWRGTDGAPPRSPEWPGAVAGRGGRRRPGGRIERRTGQPGAQDRRDSGPHPGLHERGRRRHRAERRGGHERLRGNIGAGAGAGRGRRGPLADAPGTRSTSRPHAGATELQVRAPPPLCAQ